SNRSCRGKITFSLDIYPERLSGLAPKDIEGLIAAAAFAPNETLIFAQGVYASLRYLEPSALRFNRPIFRLYQRTKRNSVFAFPLVRIAGQNPLPDLSNRIPLQIPSAIQPPSRPVEAIFNVRNHRRPSIIGRVLLPELWRTDRVCRDVGVDLLQLGQR